MAEKKTFEKFADDVRDQDQKQKSMLLVGNMHNGQTLLRKYNRAGKDVKLLEVQQIAQLAKEIVIDALAENYAAAESTVPVLREIDSDGSRYLLEQIFYEHHKEIDFIPEASLCERTFTELLSSINQLRIGKLMEAYKNASDSKMVQMKKLLAWYEGTLEEKGLYDRVRMLEKACEVLAGREPFFAGKTVGVLLDCDYTALEKQFIELLTGGLYTEVVSDTAEVSHIFYESYGMANEVDYIVRKIRAQELPLGEVTVFYPSAKYEPYLRGAFDAAGMSYRFVNGVSAKNSVYLNWFLDVLNWAEADYLYEKLEPVIMNPLMRLQDETEQDEQKQKINVFSVFAKAVKRGIGWGAERYEAYLERIKAEQSAMETQEISEEHKKQLEKLKKEQIFAQMLCELADAFKADPENGLVCAADVWKKLLKCGEKYLQFGAKYKEKIELESALKQLAVQLQWRGKEPQEQTIEIIRQSLEAIQIQEPEDSGAVSLVCVKQVYVIERQYTFVVGLSDSHFRTTEIDSPLLSDEEKRAYLDYSAGHVIFSSEKENKKKEILKESLLTQHSGLIWYGRCFYDTVELRDCAASSFYIEAEQKYKPQAIEQAGYEHIPEKGISVCWAQDASKSNEIHEQDEKTNEQVSEDEQDKQGEQKEDGRFCFSATSLQMLLRCPQQYMFKYEKFLPEIEYDQKNASIWLNPANRGNLLHRVLQEYVNEVIMVQQEKGGVSKMPDYNKLNQIFDKWCEEYQKIAAPFVLLSTYETQKEKLKKGIELYLTQLHEELHDKDNQWKVIGTEIAFEGVKCKKPTTVNGSGAEARPMEIELSGYIDRLDCCIDKDKQKYHFRIIDYKSGQQDTYDKENRNGILVQHFIYKYAIEQIAEKLLPEKNMPYVLDSARYECILEWNKKNQYSLLKIDGATLMAGLPDSVWQKLEEYFLGQANLYTATGEECSYCSYKKICQNTLKGIKKVKK